MKPRNVVTIGGGTGSFTLLAGLKKYPINISAIVSMADDGGSTGVLRDELGVLPPGDVRQCLVALSESSDTMRELMNYRFESGGLKGHSFGNLLLSALEKIKGNFISGTEEAARILNVRGEVIPVAEKDMRLYIELLNGEILEGQKQLDHNEKIRNIGLKRAFLNAGVRACPKAIDRIKKADFIIIGPGDLYGSLLPNLLIKDVSKAIRNSKAKVIYNCNLTNKKGQTENFDLDRYVQEINNHIGRDRINFVVFNSQLPEKNLIAKYEKREGKGAIVQQIKKNKKPGYRLIRADLIEMKPVKKNKNDAISQLRSFIRHDSQKLAKILMIIMELGGHENLIREIM